MEDEGKKAIYNYLHPTGIKLPSDLDSPKLERKDLYQEGFLLYNTFSPKECKYYIDESEKLGYARLNWDIIDRQNDRIMFSSPELSQLVWTRIEPFLKDYQININMNDSDSSKRILTFPPQSVQLLGCADGAWVPDRLNDRWRICKYYPGGHFGAHYDGCYVKSEDERSLFTFMIYLNTEYTGGQTRFLDDSLLNANVSSNNNNNDDRNVKIEEKDKKVMAIVGPLQPGAAVDLFHDGTSVQEGVKYIMRTDIIFKRVKQSNLPVQDTEAEARRLLRMAEELERSGQAELATTYYKKAFSMSKSLADEYGY